MAEDMHFEMFLKAPTLLRSSNGTARQMGIWSSHQHRFRFPPH